MIGTLLQYNDRLIVYSCFIFRLPTPLRRILSVAITNNCAAEREMPRTKNQSKYIHGNSSGDSLQDRLQNLGDKRLPTL